MKIKISQILEPQFNFSYKKLKEEETISGELKYAFSRLSSLIKSELAIYTEFRDKYIDECAELDEQGKKIIESINLPNGQQVQNIKIKSSKEEYLNLKLKEISEVQIEFPEFKFLELSESLQKKLTSTDLDYLNFIV